MKAVKVTFSDGDSLVTSINGTIEDIRTYYIGQEFNLGQPYDPTLDRVVTGVGVEELP